LFMLRPQRAREIPNKMCQHRVRHCGVHALDPCTLGRPMERLLVWVAVVDWASPQRLIRKVFAAWLIAHVSAVRGYLEAEVQRLQSKLVKKTSSIWEMRKPALVEAAIKNLGWSRDKAESETVGQLRLYLKEAKTAKKAITNHLPTGLQRMKHEELQEEAMNRGLEITKGKGAKKTREELIRDIKAWAEEQVATEFQKTTETPPSPSSAAGARPKPRSRSDALAFRPTRRGRNRAEKDYVMAASLGGTDSEEEESDV